MKIGRTIRRAVRPFWVAAVGAALWSNRRALMDSFQRWGQQAGQATKNFGAGDTATSGGAARWVSRMRPQIRPPADVPTAGPASGTPTDYEVGATW